MSPVTAWLCVMILYYPFPKEKNIQNEFTIYGFIFVEEETYYNKINSPVYSYRWK